MSLFLLSPVLLSAGGAGSGAGQCTGNASCPTGQVCRVNLGLSNNSFFCEVDSCTPATVRADCALSEVCINSACQCPESNPNCRGTL